MKINSEILSKFLDKVTLKSAIVSMVLKIGEGEAKVWVRSPDNVVATFGSLKLSSMTETMNLPIKDTTFFNKVIGSFKGEIELIVKENVLSVYNKERQVDIVLAEEAFIENAMPKEISLTLANTSLVETAPFKNLSSDTSMLKTDRVVVEISNKTLSLSTGEEGFDKITSKTVCEHTAESRGVFGEWLPKIATVLGDKVTILTETDKPMVFKESDEIMNIKYFIAPRVEKEE